MNQAPEILILEQALAALIIKPPKTMNLSWILAPQPFVYKGSAPACGALGGRFYDQGP